MDTEIAARGIDDVKLSDVAAAAACTVGALPHYFENKDAILLGALRHVHAAMLARGTVTAITSDLDPVETWLSALPADPEGRDEWLVWLAFTGRHRTPTTWHTSSERTRARLVAGRPAASSDRAPSHHARLHRRDPHMSSATDFTAEIGATRGVRGSHEWDRERWPDTGEITLAEMPAGSSVLYLGSTLHAAGANVSDDVRRRGLHLSYVVGWLRTEENNTLSTPPQIAAQLPRRAQELVGYKVHDAIESLGGYLGMVELRDPVEMLADGSLG